MQQPNDVRFLTSQRMKPSGIAVQVPLPLLGLRLRLVLLLPPSSWFHSSDRAKATENRSVLVGFLS
jgi:hypothetical protein